MGVNDCRVRRASSDPKAPFIQRHEHHPISGWCVWGCGCRNDGRVIRIKDGSVLLPGRQYTPAEIDRYRAWIAEQVAA